MPPNWWLVISRPREGSMEQPMLFNIIDNLGDEIAYILSIFKGETKLGRVSDMQNARPSSQRHFEKLEN